MLQWRYNDANVPEPNDQIAGLGMEDTSKCVYLIAVEVTRRSVFIFQANQ